MDWHTQWKPLIICIIMSFCLRTLLIPAYFSTDFDVHQNWLRITTTCPLQEWYTNNESKWTLDYPPLFAYLELFLGTVAQSIDPVITATINRLPATIMFQRVSVIVSQLLLVAVLCLVCKQVDFTFVSAYFSLGFLVLDNIHFQYNIPMQALLILAVYFAAQKQFRLSAFLFATLLNTKHIYLYCSLAFFAQLLKGYVLAKGISWKHSLSKLLCLGLVTLAPFTVSLAPLIYAGGLEQLPILAGRLFPFQRGLIHEYWAPNVWALYHAADKILIFFAPFLGLKMSTPQQLNGLRVLPSISPLVTICLILFASFFVVRKMLSSQVSFPRGVVVCGLVFFMFGFHVHQKAITPYISLLMLFQGVQKGNYICAATFINILNLLPLLIGTNEKMLRIVLISLWGLIWKVRFGILSRIQLLVVTGGSLVIAYHELIHPFLSPRYEFLPLLANSVFCGAFNLFWTAYLYLSLFSIHNNQIKQRTQHGVPHKSKSISGC